MSGFKWSIAFLILLFDAKNNNNKEIPSPTNITSKRMGILLKALIL